MASADIHRIGPYILRGKVLGNGATGQVQLAFHSGTGTNVAVKIISKQILWTSPSKLRSMTREIAVMQTLYHPNVVGLIGVYETQYNLYLIEEYIAGGELFEFLNRRG